MSWESVIQKAFKACGLEIHRTLPGTTYMQCVPFAYSTYRPWFESAFQELYAGISARTEVTPDRCYLLHQLCRHALHLSGDMAECGVYRGGTAYLLADTARRYAGRKINVHLFDTFAGMPAAADADPSAHRQGDFGDTSLASVKSFLAPFPDVSFYPGLIPQTFPLGTNLRFCFVHVDVDLYQATKDCCEFFYPKLMSGAVMIFDDYGFPQYQNAAHKAVDEFFADKAESPMSLGTGQCLVIKV